MGDEKLSKASSAKKFQGRDVFLRMNYLYQVADLCRDIPGTSGKKLMLHYGSQLTSVGKKTNTKMHMNVKRTLCKCCNAILVPGDTARVRLLKKPQSQVVWICMVCGTYKLFNTRPGYNVWCEKSESVVETLGGHPDHGKTHYEISNGTDKSNSEKVNEHIKPAYPSKANDNGESVKGHVMDDNVSVHIRKAVNLKELWSHYEKTVDNITEKLRAQNHANSRSNRLRVVNCFRAIDSSSLSESEELTTEDGGKTLTVLDLESCDGLDDKTKSSSSTKENIESGEKYVYDIYYTNCIDVTDTIAESYSSGYGINQELIVEEFDQNEDEEEVYEPDDEDDSNDENNWRNDYPDEDDCRSDFDENADEDDLEYKMKKFNLDEGSDLSSDNGEEDLVYNNEIDPKDVYLFGNEYAKYKARLNNCVEDLSDDEG